MMREKGIRIRIRVWRNFGMTGDKQSRKRFFFGVVFVWLLNFGKVVLE